MYSVCAYTIAIDLLPQDLLQKDVLATWLELSENEQNAVKIDKYDQFIDANRIRNAGTVSFEKIDLHSVFVHELRAICAFYAES